jgi:SDR family mycofactocin-dependent oxidoreductase
MGRFEGKVVLITGAARGQGRSHAVAFAREGADVIALDICENIATVDYDLATPDDLKETERLVQNLGQRIVAVKADVRDLTQMQRAVEQGLQQFGHLDMVCANAGIISLAKAWELTPTQWQDVIDVNQTGVWNTIKATVPHMIEAGNGGSIVITASLAGMQGQRNAIAYIASKHAIIGMMKSLANELAPHSIRVNSVNPTNVATPMLLNEGVYRRFRPDLENPTEADVTEGFSTLNLMPVPYVQSSDVSDSVLFLCSEAARFLTGVSLPVDAGGFVKT